MSFTAARLYEIYVGESGNFALVAALLGPVEVGVRCDRNGAGIRSYGNASVLGMIACGRSNGGCGCSAAMR